MPLDLDPIRARHTALDRRAWRDRIRANAGFDESVDEFMLNADDDIFALLAEVDRLTAENEGLRVELDDTKAALEDVELECDNMRDRLGDLDIDY